MEPMTHFLTGAALARAGLNRKTAYATVVAVIAAEAADLDVLWSLAGPVESFKHHRGMTHTFLAAPLVAAAVVGGAWLYDRSRQALQARRLAKFDSGPVPDQNTENTPGQKVKAPPASVPALQPARWGWLYLTALLAALSHLLLDWTNNYGVRPFFPFNARWYAGSFVFIAEPVLWLLLGLAMLMPWVLGLADQEIGARRKPFRGRGWAIFALSGMVLLWGWRWLEHDRALALLAHEQLGRQPAQRVAVEPYPVNPYRWHALVETADAFQTAEVNTGAGTVDSDPQTDLLFKPTQTDAVRAAKQTPLGQVYLDWGQWAVVRDLGPVSAPGLDVPQLPPGRRWTTVQFTDLRFAYSFLGRRGAVGRVPRTGWVTIVDGREEAGEALDGRAQR
jgi:inner membrane protein